MMMTMMMVNNNDNGAEEKMRGEGGRSKKKKSRSTEITKNRGSLYLYRQPEGLTEYLRHTPVFPPLCLQDFGLFRNSLAFDDLATMAFARVGPLDWTSKTVYLSLPGSQWSLGLKETN